MPEYKQGRIVDDILNAIRDGRFQKKLPPALELAEHFNVNFKTVNKALNQLVADGILIRKKGCGTFLRETMPPPATAAQNSLVEILFEGFTTVTSHPFWGDVWTAVVHTLMKNGCSPVLNMLEADPRSGVLRLERFHANPSAGKILLGVTENRFLQLLKQQENVPVVSVADPADDPDILSCCADFSNAMERMMEYLVQERTAQKIAFIGVTCSCTNPKLAARFECYLKAIQNHMQVNPALIENTRLLAENGYPAMKAILARETPDAVIVSGNHLIPGVALALREHHLEIPADVTVCGCDGVPTDVPFHVPTLTFDRAKCGEQAALLLLRAIRAPEDASHSETIISEFRP